AIVQGSAPSDRWARRGHPPSGLGRGRALASSAKRVLSYRPARALQPSLSVRPRPDSLRSIPTPTARGPHGPLLCDLRQGVDGRVQPAVIGDEPRSRPSPLPAEPPAVYYTRERHRDEDARLHPLPSPQPQGSQIGDPAA